MAVFSSKQLPTCSPPRKATPYAARVPVVLALRFLSLPFPSPRLVVISSSISPSPLLDESPDELTGGSAPSSLLGAASVGFRDDARLGPARPSSQPPGAADGGAPNDGSTTGLARSPETAALAYEYYRKTRAQPGFRSDQRTLRLLAKQLLKRRQWEAIEALSEDFAASGGGVLPDRFLSDRLIRGCIGARKFRLAESLLGAFRRKHGGGAVGAFASAMRGYNKLHMYSSTLRVHDQMRAAGLPLSAPCCCYLMDANRKLGKMEGVVALFREFESSELECSSRSCFRIYSILCDSLGRSGRAFEALRYFREMIQKGATPDSSSYSSLISAFAGIREAEIAEDLFLEAREKQLAKDPAVFLRLVLMYVEVGSLGKTIETVKAMKELGLGVSDCVFCAVINGHARKGSLREAVGAYEELVALGCEPGQVSYASAINVFCRLGLLPRAEELFRQMVARGYDRCVVAYSNMVSMYGKSGRAREATRLLARMKEKGCEPNVWVYNALIDMHGRAANLRQVEKLWKEMRRRRVALDKVSYTSVIGAYNKAREFGECVRLYEEFRAGGGKLDRAVAGIMVGVLSKAARVDELVQLLRDMKDEGVKPDGRLYTSALNALKDAGLQVHVQWFKRSFGPRTAAAAPPDGADGRVLLQRRGSSI